MVSWSHSLITVLTRASSSFRSCGADYGPLAPQARELGTELVAAYQNALDKAKQKEKETDQTCKLAKRARRLDHSDHARDWWMLTCGDWSCPVLSQAREFVELHDQVQVSRHYCRVEPQARVMC